MPTWFHPSLLTSSGIAFLTALVLTPVVRDIFRSYNIVDQPGVRKVHSIPIPRIGGIPIAAAYFAAMWSLSSSTLGLHDSASKILPGALIVFLTGLIDDFFNLKPLMKLLGQVIAALAVFYMGISIDLLGGQPLPVWLNLLLTVLWLLLSTNALNLIDGLDGLCAGLGLVSTITLFTAALVSGNDGLVIATLPLAGALLGFLSYNMNPATVFLGDSGALLIGFLLGCYGMIWTQKTATLIGMLVPVLALAVPLLDVLLAVLRRFLSKRPVFGADRAHLHHRLLDHGLSPRKAVGVLYAFSATIAIVALLLTLPLSRTYQNSIVLLILGIIALAVRHMRYQEFQAVGQFLVGGEFQRRIVEHLRLDRLATALDQTATGEDGWKAIVEFAQEQRWVRIRWSQDGIVLREQIFSTDPPAWTLTVPLPSGELTVSGLTGVDFPAPDLTVFAKLVQTRFREYPARQERPAAQARG